MARIKDREKALKLREIGKSYSQIQRELGVSKGTLSNWLRKYPLSKEQISLLRDKNEIRIERFRETMRKKRSIKLEKVLEEQKNLLLPLSQRELLLCGLMLYLGEGSKTDRYRIEMTNSNPDMMQFMMFWFVNILKIKKERLRIHLHLYSDMSINDEISFWKNKLDIEEKQFIKPYIKKSDKKRINYKGTFGHGTCTIYVNSVKIKDEIIMAYKVIMDNYR